MIIAAAETWTDFSFVVFHAVDGGRAFESGGERAAERDHDANARVNDDG